jgi:D-psicose/D-tagatose/L-ribulose 3-epimerase
VLWCDDCRYETNLLNTAAQAMELIEGEVQHPNVFVHLDSYHMNIEENRCGQQCGMLCCGVL